MVVQKFNIAITIFSTSGVMGWGFWQEVPLVACVIISVISLLKLLQTQIIPSEKQLEEYSKVADFYFNFYLEIEKLWLDIENETIDFDTTHERFMILKQSERETNKTTNNIHKALNKRLAVKSEEATLKFINRAFEYNFINN